MALPPRLRSVLWLGATFLVVNTAVRAGLLAFEGDRGNLSPGRLLGIFALGLLFDLAALAYLLAPFGLLAAIVPNGPKGRTIFAAFMAVATLTFLFTLLFTAVAEFVFWNEFSSRFNFIAVDYLLYTREVLGNIWQSYPLGWILAGLAALSLVSLGLVGRRVVRAARGEAGSRRWRWSAAGAALVLPLLSFFAVDVDRKYALGSPSARELAGNGYFEFLHALRSNDLDFATFYRTLPWRKARRTLRDEFTEAHTESAFRKSANPLTRSVPAKGPIMHRNVVLVSIESLGADYVESFGGRPGLTPNLDRLAGEGLMFTRLYATGLRTVRGLEALTLSVPPTPGHAVPMRVRNKGFQTLGGVFAQQGYDALYIYGGYSYFDNMRDFFTGNGYTVLDRSAIPEGAIHHETIWGVADEDLYSLALREIDRRAAAGRPVFAHVMTTSNHRPYTYPEGRVPIPSGTGRDGAVAYTDWAIGDFMARAAKRAWFADTVFVFVADHTSHGRGRTDLPPEHYRIPLVLYSPAHIPPGRVDTLASQIDVGPTLLALLNFGYTSTFFGQDILTEGQHHQRAFMANYLTVGYMEEGLVVELSPKSKVRVLDAVTGVEQSQEREAVHHLVEEAVAHYEVASRVLGARQVKTARAR